ncbi:gamete and mating-type specific protein A-like isoform X2 [Belonocnema kinseyi]|nr:gamete and mating-type specific protein A-like isoform X2 [Belonocnema kinseyi]XP_033227944.1 gamete and mating-type specific protein A-like isoform X2 [Belonocnema kinseyi]
MSECIKHSNCVDRCQLLDKNQYRNDCVVIVCENSTKLSQYPCVSTGICISRCSLKMPSRSSSCVIDVCFNKGRPAPPKPPTSPPTKPPTTPVPTNSVPTTPVSTTPSK